jgi:hypothetical protein
VAEVELTSVPGEDARRSARVDFNAQVELLAQDELEPTPRVIVARAFDLGAGGIGLALRERLSVGTHVVCRLALEGRDAALSGRVAWLRAYTSPRPHGLGVCFDALDEQQRELLAHVIDRTQAGYRPVELCFSVGQTPVIARARPTFDGLRVSAPLPLLNRGTELAVRFEGEGQAFIGRISGIAISEHDGNRRLEVDLVALADASSVRFRRQARYGNADELASADGPLSTPSSSHPADEQLTETGRRAARPRRRALAAEAQLTPVRAEPATSQLHERSSVGHSVLTGLRIAGTLLLAVACGAGASAWLERSWRAIDAQPIEDEASATRARSAGTAVGASTGLAAFPRERRPETASSSPAPSSEAALRAPPSVAAKATPSIALDALPSATTAPILVDSLAHSAAVTQASTPAAQGEPTLSVKDGVTMVAIPFAGSLDGMRTTTWASPAAVAVDLPHGRARVLHGYYPMSGGIAAGLRVRQRGDELLVRVLLAQSASRIAVSASAESLEIKLTSAP